MTDTTKFPSGVYGETSWLNEHTHSENLTQGSRWYPHIFSLVSNRQKGRLYKNICSQQFFAKKCEKMRETKIENLQKQSNTFNNVNI